MHVSLAKTVERLELRRAALAGELAAIDAQLRDIARAVQVAKRSSTMGLKQPLARVASDRRTKPMRRSWFAKNEAAGLLRRIAQSPKAPAEVVREIGKIKGYRGKLSLADKRRFEGAAYMAIAQALKIKALRRSANGQIVAA